MVDSALIIHKLQSITVTLDGISIDPHISGLHQLVSNNLLLSVCNVFLTSVSSTSCTNWMVAPSLGSPAAPRVPGASRASYSPREHSLELVWAMAAVPAAVARSDSGSTLLHSSLRLNHQSVSSSRNGNGTVFTALNLPTLFKCSFSSLQSSQPYARVITKTSNRRY